MAVTYGFYNSLNKDRMYNAEQMSAIFDGIITDGVFGAIGDKLMPVAGTGMQVIVKTGKCWFNSTWTLNDAQLPLDVEAADVSLTRIDAVVVEINSAVGTRANSIKVIKGTPSANPAKPTLSATETLHQYALGYITVAAGVTAITAANIEVNVGKATCPFITSVLQQTDITDLFNQWNAEFSTWFANVQSQLSGDIAANLQRQIDEKVNLSDKATQADMENETSGKWVDAAMIGGNWSIGDLKASLKDSLGDSWGLCDGNTFDQDTYPALTAFLKSKVSFTNPMLKSPFALPNNSKECCPTCLGTILSANGASTDTCTLSVFYPNDGRNVNTGMSMYDSSINEIYRLNNDNLYFFLKSTYIIDIINGSGELVSEVTITGGTLGRSEIRIDQYGSILFIGSDSGYEFYGAQNAIDFGKISQTITVHKIGSISSNSVKLYDIAIIGEYGIVSHLTIGSNKNRSYYTYFKLSTTSTNDFIQNSLDSGNYPNRIVRIIPVDATHAIFDYAYWSSANIYDRYALSTIEAFSGGLDFFFVTTEMQDYGYYLDGNNFYILYRKMLGKMSINLSAGTTTNEIVDLPKMPTDACKSGSFSIAENYILHIPVNSKYAFSTGLIVRPDLTNENFNWFIKQK